VAGDAPRQLPGDVELRDVTDDDLPIVYEHQLDPEATRMAAFPARGREAYLAHWAKILADETVGKKTILFDGQVAGYIVSFEQDGDRNVGYWIGRAYWGKGIATRALAAFLDHETARPLYARVAKQNVGSIRVLEKCGFVVCREEKGFPGPDGEGVDELILKLDE
jgi:RimJ/RimL family protein N-acetyltransferase